MEFQTDEQICSDSDYNGEKEHSTLYTNCSYCNVLMNEIILLRNQINRYQDTVSNIPQKQFTFLPTLHAYHNDQFVNGKLSLSGRNFTKSVPLIDYHFQEEVVKKCFDPLPNPYFSTSEFVYNFLCQCDEMCRILSAENRLLRLQTPCYVFGDIHGNLTDLLSFAKKLWPLGMHLTPGSFLFLGDYVDRGANSIEVLTYLFSHKIMIPDKVFLLRGNHEVHAVNGYDGHYGTSCLLGQLKERFQEDIAFELWNRVNQVFDYLPLAATIDDVIFCVHGGIPRPVHENEAISISLFNCIPSPYKLVKPQNMDEAIVQRFVTDLLWSDPARTQQESLLDEHGFGEGERGPGAVCFGQKAVEEFIMHNNLSHIFRAHEPTAFGVSVRKGGKVITIFSTSKDHNCRDAFCGCILVDGDTIIAINHSEIIGK